MEGGIIKRAGEEVGRNREMGGGREKRRRRERGRRRGEVKGPSLTSPLGLFICFGGAIM